jgi:hypothetical protein
MARHSESLTRFLPRRVLQGAVVPAAAAVVLLAPVGTAGAAAGPVLKQRPAVAGAATQGSRLFVSHGSWSGASSPRYSYAWYRCDTMGRHCRFLRGVDNRSHTLGENDVGHTLSVAVRATDSAGSTRAFASLVGPVAGMRPHIDSIAQPLVVGSPLQGRTVRVGTGRWRPKPSAFVFQWARCNADLRACTAISGETRDTHDIGAADLGHVLVAIVQARSGATSRAVFSTATGLAVAAVAGAGAAKPTGVGPSITTAPAVAEVLQQGNQLTGSVGSWAGKGTITYTYSWYRCDAAGAHCKSIHGATRLDHLESARDVGHTLGFAVNATDSAGTTTAYAALLGPVAAAGATLVSTGSPAISGTPSPGQTLQVSSGSWSQPPSALGYQWQRCNPNGRLCTPIAGAVASSYTVTTDDSGHKLLAVVHATAGTAVQDSLSGAALVAAAAPPAGPSSSAAPTVAGTVEQGSQLTGSAGSWTGSGTIAYGFNWFRCDAAGAHCLSIHGATKPTYTQGAKDVGHTIGFAVHATDSAGTSTAYASLLGPVAAANAPLASTGQPTVGGTAAPGQAVQAAGGSWSQPPSAVGYQWQRCNANGRLCAPIDAATASTYTVAAADTGHTLLVVETASLNGAQQAALSTHTGVIP